MSLVREAKSSLARLGASPRKRLGQNFMVDEETLSFIADSLSLKEGETVLEIGAGLGFLTRRLAETGARVAAVEKDKAYAGYLRNFFKDRPVEIFQKDILDTDLKRDLNAEAPLKVAGNIPYNITSLILEWLIGQRALVSEAVLTVQWEVGERLRAVPGGKSWGPLSIFVQVYSDVSLLKKIGRRSFYPAPEVDSSLLKFRFPEAPAVPPETEKIFFYLVRKAFQKRRKTLRNALVEVSEAFSSAGISGQRRPETLSIAEWAGLSEKIHALKTPGADIIKGDI